MGSGASGDMCTGLGGVKVHKSKITGGSAAKYNIKRREQAPDLLDLFKLK